MNKPRLLLISYFFPPNPAVGAQRWAHLAAYAVEHGWDIDVITIAISDIAKPDLQQAAALPPGICIHHVPWRRPLAEAATIRTWGALRAITGKRTPNAAEVASSARADEARPPAAPGLLPPAIKRAVGRAKRTFNAWIATQHVLPWARDAGRMGRALGSRHVYAAVVTSGPPHGLHLAGRELAGRLGVPLVVDYRDLWALVERLPADYASPLWYHLARRQERRALAAASLVVTNTPVASSVMREAYPELAERIITVMNGSDGATPSPQFKDRFLIGFAGTIYLDRDPRLVFRAASRVVRERGLTPSEFGMRFIGNVERYNDTYLTTIAAEEGVSDYLEILPFQPRARAYELLAEAPVLLSLPQDSHAAIPAKVFEYTAFAAWMLVLAARGSATERLLRGSSAYVIEPTDVDGMFRTLLDVYDEFRAGGRPEPVGAYGKFERREQARILFDAIDACVSRGKHQHGVPAQAMSTVQGQ